MEEIILTEKEKKQDGLAREILAFSRNTLLVNLRFLDSALSMLHWHRMGEGTLMTDGKALLYHPLHILEEFKYEKETCTRNYLHSVMHCIYRHMFCSPTLDHQVWDLACDIAVENVISELGLHSVNAKRESWQQKTLVELKNQGVKLTAEKIYHYFKEKSISPMEATDLRAPFLGDDHRIWYMSEEEKEEEFGIGQGQGGSQNQAEGDSETQSSFAMGATSLEETWKTISERIQTDVMMFSNGRYGDAGNLVQNLKEVNREKYDYTSFLKKFAVMGEAMKINDDEFDYIFYTYGLKLYDKMPLIEPLEYKEVKRIKEFVIAIDTSGSVLGDLVQQFVQKTYNILKSTESFFTKINLHIIQCDTEIQEHIKITSQEEFDNYIKTMTLKGFGGNNEIGLFRYVTDLVKNKEFTNLKGMIYLTDGYGIFPEKKPDYEVAFVFVNDRYEIPEVPPWVIRLVLEKEDI